MMLCHHIYCPYILQQTRTPKNSETLIGNVFLNSIEFNSYSDNLTSKMLYHILQFLVLRDFRQKSPLQFNEIFERNFKILIMMNLKMI